METVVGIPRALLYYHYESLWLEFFDYLKIKTVISSSTNKQIVDNGVRSTVDEACLPVKILFGHCVSLSDRVDYIFLPRMVSGKRREYFCPKLMGIPDMVKQGVPNLPKLIAPTIDLTTSYLNVYPALFEIGESLKKNKWEVIKAYHYAYKAWNKKRRTEVVSEYVMPKHKNNGKLRVAVIGHSYNILDSFINLELIERLQTMDVEVITPEMLPIQAIKRGISTNPKRMYWSLGRRMLGAAKYYLEYPDCVDGMILVVAFGCGPDSLIAELIERDLKKNNQIPLLLLTIDEHSGEAGLVTRVEAFIDLLKRREAVQ